MILGRVVLGALCEGCSAVWRSTKLLDGVWRTATESGCGAKIGANSGVGSESCQSCSFRILSGSWLGCEEKLVSSTWAIKEGFLYRSVDMARACCQGGYVCMQALHVLLKRIRRLTDALVADLTGAQQSLFGKRQWSRVSHPRCCLLAGLRMLRLGVYNRFRFYDLAGGVYGLHHLAGSRPECRSTCMSMCIVP